MSEEQAKRPAPRALTRTVIALGLVSFFTDAASDMIWPLLPVLLASAMHTSVAWAGVIEGAADATAALVKYLVGKRSDRIQRRKPFVLAGYTISSVARPLLAIATLPWHALVVRVVDRVGKGLRSAPRDALIAEDTPSERRAVAFGFHRAMDNAGAVVGPLAAVALLSVWPNNVRAVAWATAVPGALAVLAIVLLVRDRPREAADKTDSKSAEPSAELSHEFKRYLAVVALFALGNASDVFIVAQALRAGISVRDAALVWAALALVRAVAATPGGALAQRIGKRRSLALGWLVYAAAYAAFPLAKGTLALVAVTVVYGVYYGLTEGAEKALVASFAAERSLGRAYGLFALVTGVGSLVASLLFAALLTVGDGRYAWWCSASLALAASLALFAARPRVRETPPG
ncbi:MAG: MFS transporter [Myxococcales bacterium]|nr:MFS transporter [Myxococcales bacterium]